MSLLSLSEKRFPSLLSALGRQGCFHCIKLQDFPLILSYLFKNTLDYPALIW